MKAKFRLANFFWAFVLISVSLRAQIVSTTNDFGPGSFREVIANAPAGAVATFDSSLSGQSIESANGVFVLSRDVTIDASSLAEPVTLRVPDAGYASSLNNNSSLLITSAGGAGETYSVWTANAAATPPTAWTQLGLAAEIPTGSGTYLFLDSLNVGM